MHPAWIVRSFVAAIVCLSPIAASCGGGNTTSGGGGPTLTIASPQDGASVAEPFTVTFDASVPLGETSSGNDHVHVCFDGASCDSGDYQIAYGDSLEVTGLPPGEHTIEASLRNADHSAVGPTDSITVTITGGGTGESPSSGKGYG